MQSHARASRGSAPAAGWRPRGALRGPQPMAVTTTDLAAWTTHPAEVTIAHHSEKLTMRAAASAATEIAFDMARS